MVQVPYFSQHNFTMDSLLMFDKNFIGFRNRENKLTNLLFFIEETFPFSSTFKHVRGPLVGF